MKNRPSVQHPSSHRTPWLTITCLTALFILTALPATAESPDCGIASSCEQAHGVLSALLGSSSEEIRLQAALGLLENGCGSGPASAVEPGCLEPGNAQYESCKANCRKHSPDVPECFDGCVNILGAVLTHCPEARNFVAGNREQTRSDCYDCQQNCAEAYYQCNEDCRNAEPWDPSCYDKCDGDCDSQCTPPC